MMKEPNPKVKTKLRRTLIESQKLALLDRIMKEDLSPDETESLIEKLTKCNEILFHLTMEEARNTRD
jgi:hypothetical protein